jgi:hypothetical protein
MKKIVTVLSLLAFIGSCGLCAAPPSMAVKAKPPAQDTLMKADFDKAACERFTTLLHDFGHTELIVFEGFAVAKASELKANTFTAFMRCSDGKGNVVVVVVKFIKNDLAGIELKATGERRIGA